MKLGYFILLGLLGHLQYQLWYGKNGFADYQHYRQEVLSLKLESEQKHLRNQQMFAQIRDLKESTDAIEEQAREDYGMVKKDEVFYRLVKEK